MWSQKEERKSYLILEGLGPNDKYSAILRTYGAIEGFSPVHSQVDSKSKCTYVAFTEQEGFEEAYLLPLPCGRVKDRAKYDIHATPGSFFRIFATTDWDDNTFVNHECVNAAFSKRLQDRTEANCNPEAGCVTAYTNEASWLQVHQPPAKPIVIKYTSRQLLEKGVSPYKFKENCVDWKRDLLMRTAERQLFSREDPRYEWTIPAIYPPSHPRYLEYTQAQRSNLTAFYRVFGANFLDFKNENDIAFENEYAHSPSDSWAYKMGDLNHFLLWELDSHMSYYTPDPDTDHRTCPRDKLYVIPEEDRTRDPMSLFRVEDFNWDSIIRQAYAAERASPLTPLLNLVIVNAFSYCNVPYLVKLYAKGLPYFASESTVTEIFKEAEPNVEVVGVYRDRQTNRNFGFGFLYVRGTQAAERLIQNPLPAPKGRTINFEYAREKKKENTYAASQARGGASW